MSEKEIIISGVDLTPKNHDTVYGCPECGICGKPDTITHICSPSYKELQQSLTTLTAERDRQALAIKEAQQDLNSIANGEHGQWAGLAKRCLEVITETLKESEV